MFFILPQVLEENEKLSWLLTYHEPNIFSIIGLISTKGYKNNNARDGDSAMAEDNSTDYSNAMQWTVNNMGILCKLYKRRKLFRLGLAPSVKNTNSAWSGSVSHLSDLPNLCSVQSL